MIKLRGHHLVCLHYYHGDGLTENYKLNLQQRVARAQNGEEINITGSADDICRACPGLVGCICQGMPEEETIQKLDQIALAFLNHQIGDKVLWKDLEGQIKAAPASFFSSFCHECSWARYCDLYNMRD